MSVDFKAVAIPGGLVDKYHGKPALHALWCMSETPDSLVIDVEEYPEDYPFDAGLVKRLVEIGHVPSRTFYIGSEWKALDEELALPCTTLRGGEKTDIESTYGHVDLLDSARTAKLATDLAAIEDDDLEDLKPYLRRFFAELREFYAACARDGLAVLRGIV